MPRQLTISEAYLAGLCSTSICFGISCATYVALVTRFASRSWSRARIVLFIVATGMWIDALVGVGQMLRHMFNAFVYWKGEGGSDGGFSDIRDPMNYVHVR
jgi:ABC-type Fe3+-siderophore transport system permease subunit